MKLAAAAFDLADAAVGSQTLFAGPALRRAGRRSLFITCADMSFSPVLALPDHWRFKRSVQNPANLVPDPRHDAGLAATLELALADGVQDLIVCGHHPCRSLACALDDDPAAGPALRAWLGHAAGTRAAVERHAGGLAGDARRVGAAQIHVLVQVQALLAYPGVRDALDRGQLHLHAWLHKPRTGKLLSYEPAEQRFVPLMAVPAAR